MIYLDYAATAPPLPAASDAYLAEVERLRTHPGNASALHSGGQAARGRLEDWRDQVADVLSARRTARRETEKRHEILFVSGATEGNSLALTGRAAALRAAGQEPLALCLSTDHPSLRGAVAAAGEHALVEVDAAGAPRGGWAAAIAGAVAGWRERNGRAEDGVILAFAPVNNETGRWLDPAELAGVKETLAAAGAGAVVPVGAGAGAGAVAPGGPGGARGDASINLDWVHLDAAQTVGHKRIDVGEWDVDSLSFSGHKLGGTGGVLVARRDGLTAPVRGGGQQYGVRSGTVDTPAAASLAAALTAAEHGREALAARMLDWRERIIAAAQAVGGRCSLPGGAPASPHIAHLVFPGAASEALLAAADMSGLALSAGSACTAGVSGPSEVLVAMGVDDAEARCVLRVSTGWATTDADVDALCGALPRLVNAARAFGQAG
ncbi:aminotransferase class V-fold PLP-dependent enzyme [Buchananella felis]|uniref:aminotransferase class V-fold PLP-dependent enzyme n=1 Tax=Buchananella felis TaxID=3231492 RepID=UPI0035279D11